MPIVIWFLIVLMLLGLGLYTIGNGKVAEIGRVVFFCSLLVFLAAVSDHLQIELVRRR